MDVTTFFMLFSVSALFNNTFQSKFGFISFSSCLLIARVDRQCAEPLERQG